MRKRNSIKATVFIPVYNGVNDHIEETVKAVVNQKASFLWELLVVDSGSDDGSIEVVKKIIKNRKYSSIIQIPNSEFSHGKTRQWAARIAKGEFMVYITQDATPAHDKWLEELLSPFDLNEKVVAVLGKQDPRPDCIPMLKYEIKDSFANQGVDSAITVYEKDFRDEPGVFTQKTFYSDVNSATRRRFLLEIIPYRDVQYSEDQLFGRDIIDAGYQKAYTPFGYVIHSNNVGLKDYDRRLFDEVIGMRRIGAKRDSISYSRAIFRSLRGSFIDSRRIIHDRQYSWKRKLYWLVVNPLYQYKKWRGIRLANSIKKTDRDKIRKYSLEHKKTSEKQ